MPSPSCPVSPGGMLTPLGRCFKEAFTKLIKIKFANRITEWAGRDPNTPSGRPDKPVSRLIHLVP